MVKINSLTILGFRSFGKEPQTLNFTSNVAVIWGPNSQGKTNLAEAIEFLLTGCTVRRELLASASDEFADSLRNAHLDAGLDVYVEGTIANAKGETHVVRRTLVTDYGKKQECVSRLEIDGSPGTDEDLASLGVVLSQPPLRVPILTQHTLGYLFSAKPQERSTYFKAVLEAEDLEAFSRAVAALEGQLDVNDPLMLKLKTCKENGLVPSALPAALGKDPSAARVTELIVNATGELLKKEGEEAKDLADAVAHLERILKSKRSRTFPVDLFGSKDPQVWGSPEGWEAIDGFRGALSKVDEETRRLGALFQEVLRVPAAASAVGAIDCPVCETKDALTPARLVAIREKLKETDEFRGLEKQALAATRKLIQSLDAMIGGIDASCPPFVRLGCAKRRGKKFGVARLKATVGSAFDATVEAWLKASIKLVKARGKLRRAGYLLKAELSECEGDVAALGKDRRLKERFGEIAKERDEWPNAIREYAEAERAVTGPLKEVVDKASNTAGWTELIELGNDIGGLRKSLLGYVARERVRKELQGAIKAIDKGKGKVLDEKFEGLSDEVQQWWELLRPDEATFFSSLQQRPGAKRTIDMKAGLTPRGDRAQARLRDVIAVFSQSQLHCLGLALFLARVLREQTGYVVLDDPFLSSDDEHRIHFIHGAVQKLIDGSCQTIILTQCQRTRRDLENLYAHSNIEVFAVDLPVPADGTGVTKSSDSVGSRLSAVRTLVGNNTPAIRKLAGERLRDIAERFCKEVLVRDQATKGDKTAMITRYDGKNLGELIPLVQPLLTDPAHAGKLNAIRNGLNPAKHDDGVPDKGTITVCYGDLVRFKKDYLS